MEFHTKLRDYRVRCRISQEVLGDLVGVSQNQVSRWERGVNVPDVRQAAAIAGKLGVTLDHLLDDSSAMLSEAEAEMSRRIADLIDTIGPSEAYRRLVMAPAVGSPVVVEGRAVHHAAPKKGAG